MKSVLVLFSVNTKERVCNFPKWNILLSVLLNYGTETKRKV